MELARTSPGLSRVSPTYQMMEMAPKSRVEKPGDRYLGWMSANFLGKALCTAIDNEDRAAGRGGVCGGDEAEVSTQMISSLFHGDPNTAEPRALRESSMLFPLVRKLTPWTN